MVSLAGLNIRSLFTKCFQQSVLRPTFSSESANIHKTITKDVGDSSMPDKLYKTVELEIRSSETAVIKSYTYFVTSAARLLGITVGNVWSNKKAHHQRLTLLKSIHIYRKHLVQYEVRTYYQWVQLHKLTGSTADTYLEYIQRMLPEGVALKVTKISVEPVPSHLVPQSVEVGADVNPG